MAITQTKTNDCSPVQRAVGRYLTTSTAAAFTIVTGFKPRHVRVINLTLRNQMEWYEGMAAASAVVSSASGTRTLVTSLGITQNDNGFTVGLQVDPSVNQKDAQLTWLATG